MRKSVSKNMKRKTYPKELCEKAIQMRKDRYAVQDIAKKLNINSGSIDNIIYRESRMRAIKKYYLKNRDELIKKMKIYNQKQK